VIFKVALVTSVTTGTTGGVNRDVKSSEYRDMIAGKVCLQHSLANWDSCPTPAKSEGIEYLQVGPTEIRYSIAWTIFVYL